MENKKQKSTGKTIAIVILVVLLICSLGYIAYDNFLIKNDSTKAESKSKEENSIKNVDKECECNSNNNQNIPKCYGTYYGEYSDSMKYTYVLKADGTFTANYSDVSGTKGVYTINDNTISFTGKDELGGPREEDPYYSTSDFVISDDCSYIIYNDGSDIIFKLNKQ